MAGSLEMLSEYWKLIRHGGDLALYQLGDDPNVFLGATVAPASILGCCEHFKEASANPPQDTSPFLPSKCDIICEGDGKGVSADNDTNNDVRDDCDDCDCTQVVRCCWGPHGTFASMICWPREMILVRESRKEEDGSYVVSYRNAFENVNEGCSGNSRHVHASIKVATFTVTPLPIDGSGCQSECLISFLIHMKDWGGWLRNDSITSHMFPGVVSLARLSLIDALMMRLMKVQRKMYEIFLQHSQAELVDYYDGVCDDQICETNEEKIGVLDGMDKVRASVKESKAEIKSYVTDDVSDLKEQCSPAWAVTGTTNTLYYSYPGSSGWRIRGLHYLTNRVKIPAAMPMFDLYSSDLVDSSMPLLHIAPFLPSLQCCHAPFAFVLNLIYPTPFTDYQNLVTTWTAPVNVETEDVDSLVNRWGEDGNGTVRAFFTNFKQWIEGEGSEADDRRNLTFKLIPRITQGPWLVKSSVGTTPVLLGQKLRTRYFKSVTPSGCRYIEADVDITSNIVANNITKIVVNAITKLIVDLAPLIEGRSEDHLPERLIGSVRYAHLNLKTGVRWDDDSGAIVEKTIA